MRPAGPSAAAGCHTCRCSAATTHSTSPPSAAYLPCTHQATTLSFDHLESYNADSMHKQCQKYNEDLTAQIQCRTIAKATWQALCKSCNAIITQAVQGAFTPHMSTRARSKPAVRCRPGDHEGQQCKHDQVLHEQSPRRLQVGELIQTTSRETSMRMMQLTQ